MRCLYIDTSSSFLYTAIVEDEKVIAEVKEDYGQSLSEIALPKIVSMFEENHLSPKDVDKIIVVNGPGSFTGIRIGITIAKVYAWSLNIPITTILSLEAMMVSNPHKIVRVPILNARRGYVYTAIYDENDNVLLKPQHMRFEDLKEQLKSIEEYEFISNDEFDEEQNLTPYSPDFAKIVKKYKDKESMNPHGVNPEYLKLTEAEESKL